MLQLIERPHELAESKANCDGTRAVFTNAELAFISVSFHLGRAFDGKRLARQTLIQLSLLLDIRALFEAACTPVLVVKLLQQQLHLILLLFKLLFVAKVC